MFTIVCVRAGDRDRVVTLSSDRHFRGKVSYARRKMQILQNGRITAVSYFFFYSLIFLVFLLSISLRRPKVGRTRLLREDRIFVFFCRQLTSLSSARMYGVTCLETSCVLELFSRTRRVVSYSGVALIDVYVNLPILNLAQACR